MSPEYQQPVLPIHDPQTFNLVHAAIEHAYASGKVTKFLKALEGRKVRIRHFEQVLSNNLLGPETTTAYAKLENGDQGQIREFYLAQLEQVAPEIREKYRKLYAYY